jgi:hypothetical protein
VGAQLEISTVNYRNAEQDGGAAVVAPAEHARIIRVALLSQNESLSTR